MPTEFDHEKLNVYQRSLDFVEFVEAFREDLTKSLSVRDQIDRASASIPLNIAEGNGKYTARDRCRFFDIARGSAFECSAALDVLVRRKMISEEKAAEGKKILLEIVSMLVGLIRSQKTDRLHEDGAEYNSDCISD